MQAQSVAVSPLVDTSRRKEVMKSDFARSVALLMIIISTLIAACTERQVDDAMLTARIKARMTADGRVSPSRVDVDTLNGDVTLRGEVPTQEEKDAAVEVARKVEGVRSVSDQIIVNPAVAGTGIPSGVEIKQRAEKAASDVGQGVKKGAEDAFLLGEIKARLAAAGYGAVAVGVERGVVTLKGEASNDKDRIAVEAIAEKIKGVEKVDNQLVVKSQTPTPTPTRSPSPSPAPRRRHPHAISHMRYAIWHAECDHRLQIVGRRDHSLQNFFHFRADVGRAFYDVDARRRHRVHLL